MNLQMTVMLAEVSGEIPGTWTFLVVCLVFLATVLGAAYQRLLWPMLLEFTIIGVGIFVCLKVFVLDAHMRQAILQEQGVYFFVVAFVSLFVPLIAGVAVYIHRGRAAGQPPRPAEGGSTR